MARGDLTIDVDVVVINLVRRPDRLEQLLARWQVASAGHPITVFPAVDGGATGCASSHHAVLAAHVGPLPLLVLEDDACFAPAFTLDLRPPPDWRIAWLGGQHLTRPAPAADGWTRPRSMIRTHAYLARDPRAFVQLLPARYAHDQLDAAMSSTGNGHYALHPFTVGQAAGVSDINGRVRADDQFWN